MQSTYKYFSVDDCPTENGNTCIFPFHYKGKTHHECTSIDHDQPWCASEVDIDGNSIDGKRENCDAICTCKLGWEGPECDNESKFQVPCLFDVCNLN